MVLPMEEGCLHDRVVRLVVPDVSGPKDYWICNICNAQFVPKAAVDYKIKHLTNELGRAIREGTLSFEQATGVWREESV